MQLLIGPSHRVARLSRQVGFTDALVFRSPEAAAVEWDRDVEAHEVVAHDIVDPRPGLTAPSFAQVRSWLARRWTGVLAVTCFAGVSRSPAAAYALACRELGPGREQELARALRAAAPSVTPNARMVALADRRLGRGGALSAAIAAIGRGAEAFEGETLLWDLTTGALQRVAAAPSSSAASASCSTAPRTSPV